MEQQELQTLVEEISMTNFDRPFDHQAIFNSRLRTTGGRYHVKTHNLDFNPKIMDEFDMEVFTGIVKHELCHYHLHLQNKGYQHQDEDFQELLAEVGGLRYTPSIEVKQGSALRWVYQCEKCQLKIYRKKRFNTDRYICSNCRGKFKLQGREELSLEK